MAEARRLEAWDMVATVCMTLVDINRDPRKSKAPRPEWFNPVRAQRAREPIAHVDVSFLREVFCRPDPKE